MKRNDAESETLIAHTLTAEGHDASEDGSGRWVPMATINMQGSKSNCVVSDGNLSPTPNAMHGHDVHAVAFAIQAGALRENPDSGPDGVGVQADHAYTLEARAEVQAVEFQEAQIDSKPIGFYPTGGSLGVSPVTDGSPAIKVGSGLGIPSSPAVATHMAVRRLTPLECERLQGFPDDYTAIPGAADAPRYKALGNSMAVPVMRWIGQNIQNHS